MTMARAKRRAESATTASSAAPSRRCRCQSSGRRRVSRSIVAEILLAARKRLAIQLALGHAADARRDLRGLAWRQRFQQDLEHALGIAGWSGLAGGEDDDEFPLLAVRRRQPFLGVAERDTGHFLELLRQLARPDAFATGAGALGEL